ncbi:MAG: HEPN domain-containing protein [Candidatus Micrarchaeaceae archaeon]
MVKTPIETAKDWLQTAELALNAGRYEQAIYALEMSVEIAFKAVLISMRVEVPKVHDIRKPISLFLQGNKAVPKDFLNELDDYISTFKTLLSLRSMVGYGFEGGFENIDMKKQAEILFTKCRRIIAACETAVQKQNAGKR